MTTGYLASRLDDYKAQLKEFRQDDEAQWKYEDEELQRQSRILKDSGYSDAEFKEELKQAGINVSVLEKESDKEAIRKKLEKKTAELERSIAVYGMINVRTDGEKAIIAQKLERPRSKAEKWDIYELKPGPDGRLAYTGH